jgi:hypothetical protein
MNQSPGLTRFSPLLPFRISQTDIVRFWVIASITISIIGITYISMAAGYGTVVPQLFYFPILYTTYFYPERGMYVACSCAIAYLVIAALFVAPNPLLIGGIIFQSLLFIGIAAGSGYVLKNRDGRIFITPVDEAGSIQEMIRTGECDHIEFKSESLWSAGLSKEEITANESLEVRKYGHNASKLIIARSIAGFLNTDGGDLIIGIREDRILNSIDVVGIDKDYDKLHETDRNPDGYRRMLIDAVIRKYLPEIYDTASRFIHLSFPVVSGRTLCHAHITPSDKPVFVDTGSEEFFFIRVDATTRSITGKNMTRYILNRFSPS